MTGIVIGGKEAKKSASENRKKIVYWTPWKSALSANFIDALVN